MSGGGAGQSGGGTASGPGAGTGADLGAGPDVAAVLAGLTLEQKASLTSGSDFWHLQGLPEAGIDRIMVTDGPHGLRKQPEDGNQIGIGGSLPATCFPPAVALAAGWDPDLVRRVGEALGRETRAAGVSVLLGPGVNIKRSPLCGRNFEYFSEDPFLAGRLAAAHVRGVQSQGVGTSLKHFAANNQETDRFRVSAEVDERTLREIYLPAFEHVVKEARPLTVMCSYNRINGTYASEHRWLLTEVLREEWGFTGAVVSDWGAVSDRVRALAAGLDVEMPPTGTDDRVVAAVRDGRLTEEQVDAAARRVLELVAATADARADAGSFDPEAHHALAREAATAGVVLLKNEGGLLPLDPAGGGRIAVLGEFARTPRYQGGGSSRVVPTRLDTALDAIRAVAGERRVTFAAGFAADGGADPELLAEAVAAAREAEVAVLFLGLPDGAESEGSDRADMELPLAQQELLAAVHAVNPATVVVLSNGAAVSVAGWQDRARALLEGWLLGQAGGSATADLLFGLANPSGCLAETLPLRLADTPAFTHFPGAEQRVSYGEGIYVGYRHYDTRGLPVAYPFGHGLSYTDFELGALTVRPVPSEGPNVFDATVPVTNTGARAGARVVQVYVHAGPGPLDRPEQELKGFAKVALEPGETREVTVRLDERSFAAWSVARHGWWIPAGEAEVRAGFSSRDIRARATVTLPGDGRPVTLDATSTLAEWLAEPHGAALLRPLLDNAGPHDPSASEEDRAELFTILGGIPLDRVASFVFGVTHDRLNALVTAYAEAVTAE
jgi:beta-glucosidase